MPPVGPGRSAPIGGQHGRWVDAAGEANAIGRTNGRDRRGQEVGTVAGRRSQQGRRGQQGSARPAGSAQPGVGAVAGQTRTAGACAASRVGTAGSRHGPGADADSRAGRRRWARRTRSAGRTRSIGRAEAVGGCSSVRPGLAQSRSWRDRAVAAFGVTRGGRGRRATRFRRRIGRGRQGRRSQRRQALGRSRDQRGRRGDSVGHRRQGLAGRGCDAVRRGRRGSAIGRVTAVAERAPGRRAVRAVGDAARADGLDRIGEAARSAGSAQLAISTVRAARDQQGSVWPANCADRDSNPGGHRHRPPRRPRPAGCWDHARSWQGEGGRS
jgi:hypothetical protein